MCQAFIISSRYFQCKPVLKMAIICLNVCTKSNGNFVNVLSTFLEPKPFENMCLVKLKRIQI